MIFVDILLGIFSGIIIAAETNSVPVGFVVCGLTWNITGKLTILLND